MQENQPVLKPTKDEFIGWKNSSVTKYYHQYLSEWLQGEITQFVSGGLLNGKSVEEIAIENIKTQTRAAINFELMGLDYKDIVGIDEET